MVQKAPRRVRIRNPLSGKHRAPQRTAPGTTWAKITNTADRALPGMPPRAQATTARADQLAGQQAPFDLECIATYHDHGCLHRTKQRPLPSAQGVERGRCAFQNVIRLSSHTKKGHPKAAPVTIIATSAAPPPPHRQAWCRSTANAE